jgi:hypothetical protein
MPRFLRSPLGRLATGCAALGLVAAGIALGAPSASGAGGGPTDIDHFLCYTAAAVNTAAAPAFPQKAAAVEIQNQFVPNGYFASLAALNLHCNPVQKTTPDGAVTPITNPIAHLLCWAITPNPLTSVVASHNVIVTNQFGQAQLKTGPPRSLCLPSFKDENSPANFPPDTQPPGLDHYTCYPVAYPSATSPRFKPPQPVQLQDQFGLWTARVLTPKLLCLPTQKTVDPAVPGQPIIHPEAHLLCFGVSVTPAFAARNVFAKNQFGIGQVSVKRTSTLCVPSFKDIAPGG